MTSKPSTVVGAEYPMPPTGEMINQHTLAYHIINSHDATTNKNGVFDLSLLARLRRFVDNPEQKDQILREVGMSDAIENPELAAQKHNCLVGYIMARHGTEVQRDIETGEVVRGTGPVFHDSEIDELRSWFAQGIVRGLDDAK